MSSKAFKDTSENDDPNIKPSRKRKNSTPVTETAPTPVKELKTTPKEALKSKSTPKAPKKRAGGPSPKSTPNRKGESPVPIKLYQNTTLTQCLVCQESVSSFPASQKRHVWKAHMKPKPVIFCPRCDFSHEYDLGEVQTHMINEHPGKSVSDIIDKRERYGAKVREFLSQCFGAATPKKRKRAPPAKTGSSTKKRASNANTSNASGRQSRAETLTCSICSEEVRNVASIKRRHAYSKHLGSPEWVRCNLCETGFRTIETGNISKHVKSIHEHEDPDIVLTDNRFDHKDELQSMIKSCFS